MKGVVAPETSALGSWLRRGGRELLGWPCAKFPKFDFQNLVEESGQLRLQAFRPFKLIVSFFPAFAATGLRGWLMGCGSIRVRLGDEFCAGIVFSFRFPESITQPTRL